MPVANSIPDGLSEERGWRPLVVQCPLVVMGCNSALGLRGQRKGRIPWECAPPRACTLNPSHGLCLPISPSVTFPASHLCPIKISWGSEMFPRTVYQLKTGSFKRKKQTKNDKQFSSPCFTSLKYDIDCGCHRHLIMLIIITFLKISGLL